MHAYVYIKFVISHWMRLTVSYLYPKLQAVWLHDRNEKQISQMLCLFQRFKIAEPVGIRFAARMPVTMYCPRLSIKWAKIPFRNYYLILSRHSNIWFHSCVPFPLDPVNRNTNVAVQFHLIGMSSSFYDQTFPTVVGGYVNWPPWWDWFNTIWNKLSVMESVC